MRERRTRSPRVARWIVNINVHGARLEEPYFAFMNDARTIGSVQENGIAMLFGGRRSSGQVSFEGSRAKLVLL